MTGPMQRIFRRRSSGSSGRGVAGLVPRLPAGLRRRRSGRKELPWGKKAEQGVPMLAPGTATTEVIGDAGSASFRERGRLRRRLRFLRRARELAFRDVGGLMFDMRRFGRDRPDLVEAKLNALAAVDNELRALERVLDDKRPIHELREPGLSSCPRCGALHASEDNFCPHCGLQFGGAQAMGEVGGAIAAPPQAPPAPIAQGTTQAQISQGIAPSAPPPGAAHVSPGAAPSAPPPAAGASAATSPPSGAVSQGQAAAEDRPAPEERAPEPQPTEILHPPDKP
jgi:hypothetical protein